MPTRKPKTPPGPYRPPRIHPRIEQLAVPIDSLTPFYKNPNEGDEDTIERSLKRNGQYKPITVNVGTLTGRPDEILAGNHTWKVAKERLGWTDIAATYVDVPENEARRIVATDNESAAKAKRNAIKMLDLLDPIKDDLEGSSVTADDFAKLAGADGPAPDQSDLLGEQKFAVIVNCRDEEHQLDLLEKLEAEGLDARALVQ